MKNIPLLFLVLITICNPHVALSGAENITQKSNPSVATQGLFQEARTRQPQDKKAVIRISRPLVIIVLPDSEWINKERRKNGEEDWNEIVADHEYYEAELLEKIRKRGIEVLFIQEQKRYIEFVKADKSSYTVDRNKMTHLWGLILFNPLSDPLFYSDLLSIDDVLLNKIFPKPKRK